MMNFHHVMRIKLIAFLFSCFDNPRITKRLFFSIIIVLFVVVYVFNYYTPLTADDFSEQNRAFSAILSSTIASYFDWSGRFVAYFLGKVFMWMGKPIFNVLNTVAYLMLVLLIYFHAVGHKKIYPALLWGIASSLFVFVPAWGQDFLWISGATSYLWCPVIVLLYLLPLRFQYNQDKLVISNCFLVFLYTIFGIVAGCSNESLSIGMIVITGAYLFSFYHKKKKIPMFMKLGFIGNVVGTLILLLAPGNFHRYAVEGANHVSYGVHVWDNFANITKMFYDPGYLLFPCIILAVLWVLSREKEKSLCIIYIIGFIVTLYSMIVSPYFVDRAKINALIFIIIAFSNLYTLLDFDNAVVRKVIIVSVIGLTIGIIPIYNAARHDIRHYNAESAKRITLLEQAKNSGQHTVTMPPIQIDTKYTSASGNEYWNDRITLEYFGLNDPRIKK